MTGSSRIVVDSSGWVEYFGEGPNADAFAVYLEREDTLLMPSIVIYEVFKKLMRTSQAVTAERFLSHALRAEQVSLDVSLAIEAARASAEFRLAMADAIVYTTARAFNAPLITGDVDFQGLPGAVVIA